ncbi:MAG: phosphatidylglycerophosphatase A [Campylobacterota bacterium]|nr:phosphatidylglycerophosphatase A [Campylobacterota bacterium]
MNWFFITVAYSGLAPKAPGTAGSFVALLLGVFILIYLGEETLFYATLLAMIAGVKMIDNYEAQSQSHDDKRIVIDELVGMWLALAIAPGVQFDPTSLLHVENGTLIQIVLSFVFFRIYDIKKPSYIGRIDRDVKGGIGVMGDDVLAGIAAGITAALLWQGWLELAKMFQI